MAAEIEGASCDAAQKGGGGAEAPTPRLRMQELVGAGDQL